MKNLILPLLLFASLIISCTKENPPIIEVPIVIPDTVTTPDTIINPYVKYTYEGNWRYTDYKIVQNVGIVQIDTTYPGILELNISSDTIKNIPYIQHLRKGDLIQDSMVWMKQTYNCRCGARIDLSSDEKEVKYLREFYSPQGGPSRFYFEGNRN